MRLETEKLRTRSADMRLFPGVRMLSLSPHMDSRGMLTEVYRQDWIHGVPAFQINVMVSRAGVLRGAHVHLRHSDYFIIPRGRGVVGLHDSRTASPTFGEGLLFQLEPDEPAALIVPPGVVHGVYFPVDSLLITVESEAYDPEEEIRCRWSDPALRIPWPFDSPCISAADAAAPSYREMMQRLQPFQSQFA